VDITHTFELFVEGINVYEGVACEHYIKYK